MYAWGMHNLIAILNFSLLPNQSLYLKMRHFKFLFLLLFVFSSCKEVPERKFERQGVHITSPTGWEIVDEENLQNVGYSLTIKRDVFPKSGFISFTWINGEIGIQKSIAMLKKPMLNNIIYENANLEFGQEYKGKYNDINASIVPFSFTLLGDNFQGEIYCFYENKKTFTIFKQEPIDDHVLNKSGFDFIEQNFKSYTYIKRNKK